MKKESILILPALLLMFLVLIPGSADAAGVDFYALWKGTGFPYFNLGNSIMILVGILLIYLAIHHRTQEDWSRLIAVQDRLIVLLPQAWVEYRDRGLAHAQAGHAGRALEDLETYLVNADEGVDLDAIAERVAELKRTNS